MLYITPMNVYTIILSDSARYTFEIVTANGGDWLSTLQRVMAENVWFSYGEIAMMNGKEFTDTIYI